MFRQAIFWLAFLALFLDRHGYAVAAKLTTKTSSASASREMYDQRTIVQRPVKQQAAAVATKLTTKTSSASASREMYDQRGIVQRPMKQPAAAEMGMHNLLTTIFSDYDKELTPHRPVIVRVDLLLLKLKGTIEKESVFESVIGLFIEWHDERMEWEPELYDNVTVLACDSDRVWLPDIALTNSADHVYSISRDTQFVVRATSDGVMKFVPTGTVRTFCDLRLFNFPFDYQTCTIELESWSLDTRTMALDGGGDLLVDESFTSTQWMLCGYKSTTYQHTYNFTGEAFTRLRYDLFVKRKATFYVINLIFPCATLSFIQLLVFVIPSTESTSDRVGFGTTNLLTLVVFQTIVTEEMPKTSDAVTTLSKYVISLIIIAAIGIMESVIVERMRRLSARPPPRWLAALANVLPGPFLGDIPASSEETTFCQVHPDGADALAVLHRTDSFSQHRAKSAKQPSVKSNGVNGPRSFLQMEESNINDSLNDSTNSDKNGRPVPWSAAVYRTPSYMSSMSLLPPDQQPNGSSRSPIEKRTGLKVQFWPHNCPPPNAEPTVEKKKCRDVYSTLAPLPAAGKRNLCQCERTRNNRLWVECAARLDTMALAMCLTLAVSIPMGLFIPLVYGSQPCDTEALLKGTVTNLDGST